MTTRIPKIARTMQTAYSAVVVICALVVVLLVRKTADADSHKSPPYYLLIEVCVAVFLGLLPVLATIGLWRKRSWGWLLGIGINSLIALVAAYGLISELVCGLKGPLITDITCLAILSFFGTIAVLLLAPASRAYFRSPVEGNGTIAV